LSAEQDKIRTLAERIASRLAGDARAGDDDAASAGAGDEVAQLLASLRELQRRLAHVESHVGHGEDCGPSKQRPSGAAKATTTTAGGREAARPSGGAREAATPPPHHFLSSTYVPAAHPSQEHFQIDEAVSELVDFFEREKVCSVEPGEKPCDHCSMCSSRGF
jgi:hypothetical protein